MSTLRVDNLTTLSGNGIAADIASVSGAQLSNRNKVHNGDMRISQRYGTNAHTPSTTTRNYVIDRWAYWSNQASKASVQQVTDAPAGFYNSAKCTSLSAHTADSGHWFGYLTTIEAQDIYDLAQGTANAKNITLSFYVKSSITGTWAAAIRTKGSSPDYCYPYNYTISNANTWEKKELTFPADTGGGGIDNNNGSGLEIYWVVARQQGYAGTASTTWGNNTDSRFANLCTATIFENTNDHIMFTGVQLEVGDTATSFEHRSFHDELLRCQRYYAEAGVVLADGTPERYHNNVSLPVEMRAIPTRTVLHVDSGSGGNMYPNWGRSGGAPTNASSTRQFYQGSANSAISSAFISFNAEL